jgi:hypothetical protein
LMKELCYLGESGPFIDNQDRSPGQHSLFPKDASTCLSIAGCGYEQVNMIHRPLW